MKSLYAVANVIDKINEKIGEVVSWSALLLVLVTVWDVALRYLFNSGSVAFQELEWHLYAANFLLAGGWTMLKGGHVNIEIFYMNMGIKKKAWIELIGAFLFCLPFCLVVIWSGWSFFIDSWSMGEGTPDPGGLPARYLLKATIPLGFGFIALQAFSEAIKSYFKLSKPEKEEESLG